MYILENWQSFVHPLQPGETHRAFSVTPSSVSSLTSPRARAGIHGDAFHGLSVPASDCKKYSQVSHGINAFALPKVGLLLGFIPALTEKGLGWYSVSETSSVQWNYSELFKKPQTLKTPQCFRDSPVLCLASVVDFGSGGEWGRVSWVKRNLVLGAKLQLLPWCCTGVWPYSCTVVFFLLGLFWHKEHNISILNG